MLPRSLNREFAFTLNDVARMLRTYADYKGGQFGITRAQWVVLVRLDRFEGLKQSELAEMLDLQPITLTRLLDRLCDSGLIERRADPERSPRQAAVSDRRGAAAAGAARRPWRGHDGDRARRRRRARAVEQMVAQLAVVKENLRQAIQQRSADRGGGAQLWLRPLLKNSAGARRSAGQRARCRPAAASPKRRHRTG